MESLLDLSPAALLAAEESGVLAGRRADVDAMDRLLAWCDLHSGDPQDEPCAVPVGLGGNRLTRLGGEGTPDVAELCFEEFAVAAHAGVIATAHRAADFLDLRHRLPNVESAVRALDLPLWVARKVASMSRKLSTERVEVVDLAVAAAALEAPGRILAIAEAKVIEADVAAHRARIAADEAKQGVWVRRRRAGQAVDGIEGADVQGLGMKLSTAGCEALDETIEQVAVRLADDHVPTHADDVPTMDWFRARAAELLADPAAVLRLLAGPDDTTDDATGDRPASPSRRPAELLIHLDASVLVGQSDGVARVEGIGPLLLEQVAELLRHRDITLQPVIDLNVGRAVNGYEHPTKVKKRTRLRTTRDVFPHSSRRGTKRLDDDHPTPYVPPDKGGPPGQTGDHNDAPLGRRDHRAKTHLGYRVKQLGLGAYRWETPHGLGRVVTGRGTERVRLISVADGLAVGELYDTRFDLRLGGDLATE